MVSSWRKKGAHNPDYFILGIIVLLTLIGIIMLGSTSSFLAKLRFNDSFYYLKSQLWKGLAVGAIGFLIGYLLPYKYLKKLSFVILLLSLIIMSLVFTNLGVERGGATRWISFGPVTFQPSEIIKISFVLYMAAWISNRRMNRQNSVFSGFIPFLIVIGGIAALLLKQPATSTVVILLGTGLVMYLLSGAPWRYIIACLALFVLLIGAAIYVTPYRANRILSFFSSEKDITGSGYHSDQAMIAIGSGKIFGLGYGESTSKINFLPDPIADSVFAVIAEETGFVGAAFISILFAMLTIKILWLSKNMSEKFAQQVLLGFGIIIGGQAFMHMASISGLLPLTGIPLPFISYGGTSLAVFLTIGGIILNISRHK